VDESSAKSFSYDLIIGRDLMHEIDVDICFSAAEVRWDNASIPMQPVDKSTEEFDQQLLFAQDPLTTNAERIQNKMESKYCPVNLNKIATECHMLNSDQQETLHKVLRKFAHLFDGALGNWKTDPVDLEHKEKNDKEYKNILLDGLKASVRVLCCLLLIEIDGVTLKYLSGKKHVVADVSSHLDVYELKIQNEESLTLLSEVQISNIKFPMHIALIFKVQKQVIY
jgi:hypothetical protein